MYRCSVYCVEVPCEDGSLFYNTLTGELALRPLISKTEEDKEWLIRHRFLVPQSFEEQKYADQIQSIAGLLTPAASNKTNFTILTTTDCNARCFYCYEIGIKRISMTADTAVKVADYIAKSCGGKKIKLRWFGGEPLYNRQAIDIICNRLKELGIEYESSMISNGYYFTGDVSKHACACWNLRRIQITIDGTETTYNRIKAYIDADENPYCRVMDNIKLALEAGVNVTVRMNMDAQNAQDLLQLSDDLARRFSNYTNFNAYVALLHEFSGKIHKHETIQKKRESYNLIREKLAKYGILRKYELPQSLRRVRCMADDDECEAILPDGRVGRCEHYSESMITGSIPNEDRDVEVEKQWKIPLSVPECRQCALYPICRRLKMCEWNKDGCPEPDCGIEIDELKEQIAEAYQKYKRRNE